jgi:hypothetical protein
MKPIKSLWVCAVVLGVTFGSLGAKDRDLDDNKAKKASREKSGSSANRSATSPAEKSVGSSKPGVSKDAPTGINSKPGTSNEAGPSPNPQPANQREAPAKTPDAASDRTSRTSPAEPARQPKEATTRPTRLTETKQVPVPLVTKEVPGGGRIKTTPSGQVREKVEKKSDGEHTQQFAPTGRVQKEVVQKKDGTQQTVHYAANGRVQKTVSVARDGGRETTQVQYDRNGRERASETVKVDVRGREVSKTVVVKQTTVLVRNTTIVNNTTIVRNYDRTRYGFAYRPVYVVHSPVFVSWYDPYWYTPSGVLVVHPFRYSWGWENHGWYRHQHHYWATYEVYPAPCYWVTDWLIAGYVADRYATEVSLAQAREEARIAREDAERAREAAAQARVEAEIAEARAAQREAEARLAKAEARAAKAEAEEGKSKEVAMKPNANATPIDPETKEVLRVQVERTIAEKKAFAEQSSQGGTAVPPDLSRALSDPKHIYPVSSPVSVIAATDQNEAGMLTEGDLLRLEPGQEKALKDADENTFVTMRVMTSKGEEGEVKAGTLVSIPLKTLQDFDSEFRAKLDLGLAEADRNKEQFKSPAAAL